MVMRMKISENTAMMKYLRRNFVALVALCHQINVWYQTLLKLMQVDEDDLLRCLSFGSKDENDLVDRENVYFNTKKPSIELNRIFR